MKREKISVDHRHIRNICKYHFTLRFPTYHSAKSHSPAVSYWHIRNPRIWTQNNVCLKNQSGTINFFFFRLSDQPQFCFRQLPDRSNEMNDASIIDSLKINNEWPDLGIAIEHCLNDAKISKVYTLPFSGTLYACSAAEWVLNTTLARHTNISLYYILIWGNRMP